MERNIHELVSTSSAISPISEQTESLDHHRRRNHPPRKIANLENLDSAPMIMQYLRAGMMPSALIEELGVLPKQLKVEEDVLVMDGIMVEQVVSSGGRSRGGPLSTSDSGGSSSFGGNGFYRREICRWWKDSGSCRYGAKCQFAHGNEKLRQTRFRHKNKPEAQICKSLSSESCNYGSKCRFSHHQVNSPASSAESAAMVPFATTQTITPIKVDQALSYIDSSGTNSTSTDWSPLDDCIDVTLPSFTSAKETPSMEEIDAYIKNVLYPTNPTKRLPVFVETCSKLDFTFPG